MPTTAQSPARAVTVRAVRPVQETIPTIGQRRLGSVHGRVTAEGVEITWTLPQPVLVSDHETVALVAEIITPSHDDLEIALFITPDFATGCLTALEALRPRELEQTDAAYSTDGTSFTATFPHRWTASIRHDAGIAGSVSVDGGLPERFAGLLEAHRRTA